MPKYKIRAEETIYAIYETEINADNKNKLKNLQIKYLLLIMIILIYQIQQVIL